MIQREEIIKNYVTGYNNFDISKMVSDLDENIEFTNIHNGETNLTLAGLEAFKEQAEQAKTYFTERELNITSFKHNADKTEIEIDYRAILAIDFPNGLNMGEELKLTGRSIFEFKGDKIIRITDIS